MCWMSCILILKNENTFFAASVIAASFTLIYLLLWSCMNTNGNHSASWHLWRINAGVAMPRQVGWVTDLPFDVSEPQTAMSQVQECTGCRHWLRTSFWLVDGIHTWYHHEHFLEWPWFKPCSPGWEIVYLSTILATDSNSAFVRTHWSWPQHPVTTAKVAEEGIKAEKLIVFALNELFDLWHPLPSQMCR